MLKFDDDIGSLLAEAAALDAKFSAAAATPAPTRDPSALLALCRAIETLTDDLMQLSLEELLSVEHSLSGFRHRVEMHIAQAR